MKHLNIHQLGKNDSYSHSSLHPDVVFAIPSGQEVRGVGVDPRSGLFLMLKSGKDKIYPLVPMLNSKSISSLTMVAIEVEGINIGKINPVEEAAEEVVDCDA